MTSRKLSVGAVQPDDWSDDTTAIDLSPELLEIIEGARQRARAKRLSRNATPDALPESGVLRKADKVDGED